MSEQVVFDTLKYRVEVDTFSTRWYRNSMGQLHRDCGPAVERTDGAKFWYQNGQLHRTGGPAVEYADGDKSWWQNGLLHRTDGPAAEWACGRKMWYINGVEMPEAEFNQRVKNV